MSAPIAAVTGASRGIGYHTALALAGAGYRVFALARSQRDLEELASHSPAIRPLALDIADASSRDEAVSAIMAATGGYGLDVLINNAGYGLLGPVEEVTPEAIHRQFEVNVFGLLAFTQPFLPGMRARGSGRIVNVSSAAGRVSTPFMGAYSASKYALEALSDALRLELSPFGVRVILIEPGPIKTAFGRDAAHAANPDSPYARFEARWNRAHGGSNRLGRGPEVVARVILCAVRSPHPRARYPITISAWLGAMARRFAPDWLMDRVLRLAMGG